MWCFAPSISGAAGGLHASAMSALIARDNHTFHLNEMLRLRKPGIDESAAQLSISHQRCNVCVCARSSVPAGTRGDLSFSYTLAGALSLLKHQFFIWRSLLFVTGNTRGEARERVNVRWGLVLSLWPHTHTTDQHQFSKLRKQKSATYRRGAIIYHLYLRELLCHLIDTTVIGACDITEEVVSFGSRGMKWFVRAGVIPSVSWDSLR